MGKFVVIVLDGFGVGAMPDVPQVRPADCGANTCVHIFERTPDLKLPNLASLGLANIVGREFPGLPFATDATFGRAELMHDGADTFFGHQIHHRIAVLGIQAFGCMCNSVHAAGHAHGHR